MRQWIGNAEKAFEQMAAGCNFNQFIRELVMNGLQAGDLDTPPVLEF